MTSMPTGSPHAERGACMHFRAQYLTRHQLLRLSIPFRPLSFPAPHSNSRRENIFSYGCPAPSQRDAAASGGGGCGGAADDVWVAPMERILPSMCAKVRFRPDCRRPGPRTVAALIAYS